MGLLWIGLAVLTAVVLAVLGRALVAEAKVEPGSPAAIDRDPELLVYRDQLREIGADRERGVLSSDEAEAARIEVSRRLLAADARRSAAARAVRGADSGRIRLSPVTLSAAIVLPTLGLYLLLGSPQMPDHPFVGGRHAAERADVDHLVAQVEQRLRARPDDGQGWDVIAPVYLRLQRFQDAAEAYANAGRLLGQTAARLAGFAEATILANDGVVVDAARRALEQVQALEPQRLEPRFWLALAKEQDGDLAGAATGYRALLAAAAGADKAPAWQAGVEERLRQVEAALTQATGSKPAGEKPAAAAPSAAEPRKGEPGPSAAEVEAAARMSDDDRKRMVAGMVEGLAARLEQDGRNPEGWLRLIQSYMVLGRKEEAVAAVGKARRALVGDEKALESIGRLARSLGLET